MFLYVMWSFAWVLSIGDLKKPWIVVTCLCYSYIVNLIIVNNFSYKEDIGLLGYKQFRICLSCSWLCPTAGANFIVVWRPLNREGYNFAWYKDLFVNSPHPDIPCSAMWLAGESRPHQVICLLGAVFTGVDNRCDKPYCY